MSGAVAFRETEVCRLCGSSHLVSTIDLGRQALTGVFPRARGVRVTEGPLQVVKCMGDCGLVQLRHTFEPTEMYGAEYGYRSALNRSMVEHLAAKVKSLLAISTVRPGDVVLDIGSNDGTTLAQYPRTLTLVGIDPSATKFAKYYEPHITVVPEFFSAAGFLRTTGGQRARIITSLAMFYDLDRPLDFVRDVYESLADGGLWHFEQSYLPSMLAAGSYDTICHEHVEYYALEQIRWMLERVGFSIRDVALNEINGGSFAVTAVKSRPGSTSHAAVVGELLAEERRLGIDTLGPYERFAEATQKHRDELRALLIELKSKGKKVLGLGASTKGNVLLQYCGIDADLLACIAEVNEDKFGCFTPGTEIPIVSEADASARNPDVYLVLPWHFRRNILARAAPLFAHGAKLLFPLPKIDLVSSA